MTMDFITGDKFKELADFTFSPEKKLDGDYDNLANTFRPMALHQARANIVYTHTMYVSSLFELLRVLKQYKFVVITHNSDNYVEHEYDHADSFYTADGFGQNQAWFAIPPNVIRWFTKNVNCSDNRIESIPIGIQNDRWLTKHDKKKMIEEKVKEPHSYRNLMYMNFRVGTNATKRQPVYDLFKDKPWVTVLQGQDGHDVAGYIDSIYNHKFVICPEGNGIDTHRTWETLYLGSIPIEKRNINNQFYKDLPICFVDDWEEVTEEYLNGWLNWSQGQMWNMNMINFGYWKNKILSVK